MTKVSGCAVFRERTRPQSTTRAAGPRSWQRESGRDQHLRTIAGGNGIVYEVSNEG